MLHIALDMHAMVKKLMFITFNSCGVKLSNSIHITHNKFLDPGISEQLFT